MLCLCRKFYQMNQIRPYALLLYLFMFVLGVLSITCTLPRAHHGYVCINPVKIETLETYTQDSGYWRCQNCTTVTTTSGKQYQSIMELRQIKAKQQAALENKEPFMCFEVLRASGLK